jgi:hypothetical protein
MRIHIVADTKVNRQGQQHTRSMTVYHQDHELTPLYETGNLIRYGLVTLFQFGEVGEEPNKSPSTVTG